MATYREVLRQAQKQLRDKDMNEQEAQLYMVELCALKVHDLYMEIDQEMDAELKDTYEVGIERLLKNEPLAHILGYEWFYGYRFSVNEDVLIPRPETEELVANILAEYDEYFQDQADVTLVDVGTGSGAIAVSLKKEAEAINVMGTDISEKAIAVACENARSNQAAVPFMVGDMLEPLIDRNLKVDILISNPPYIPIHEEMESSVVDYEPHVALFGGDDGLKFYRIIFENCRKVLKEKAMMAFEMGWNQKEAMIKLVQTYFPNDRYEIIKDMSGKDRMLFIYINL
ncbi:peptide chain release factor N(5)-glutamine methyltransferase [bacterium c-19]|nr:peptide chain release factor N(5)-glutamine methyltransferase [bacterium c-19]